MTHYFGSDISSWANASGGTSVTAAIPEGFYSGKQISFSDADLVAANILSGVNIFGVVGTATGGGSGPYAACTDDGLNASQCSTAASRYVTSTAGSDVSGAAGSLSANIPNGYYNGKTCSMSDADLIAGNIKDGVNIFGVAGTYTGSGGSTGIPMGATAPRNPGSATNPFLTTNPTATTQISVVAETTTYVSSDLPAGYRDIPDIYIDDEGERGSCQFAPRPTADCGTTQDSVALRIAHCASVNGSRATWDGAVQCTGQQGLWKLVSRDGANKEVWQDQRTGYIWSTAMGGANWCRASGNTQGTNIYFDRANNGLNTITGNGTVGNFAGGSASVEGMITITFSGATTFTVTGPGCSGTGLTITGALTTTPGSTVTYSIENQCRFTITQGSVNFANGDIFSLRVHAAATYSCAPGGSLQAAQPVSFCAEAVGLAPGVAGEDWEAATPVYAAQKGRMGKNTTASVRWRLPTLADYKLAEINGSRFVMPDMGATGTQRPVRDSSTGGRSEWTATVHSAIRSSSHRYLTSSGITETGMAHTSTTPYIRCVGRGL